MNQVNSTSDKMSHFIKPTSTKIKPTIEVEQTVNKNSTNEQLKVNEMTDSQGRPTKESYQIAVNKMNEFMEFNQKSSKFVFHSDLERYYVELVDAKTQEVVKEIPPKELLDAYYEMQKMIGKIFDTQV